MPDLNAEGVLRELVSEMSGHRVDSGTASAVGFIVAPGNQRCAILSRNDQFEFIDLQEHDPTPRRLASVGDVGAIHRPRGTEVMDFSPDGRTLAAGGWLDGSVTVWEFQEGGHPSLPSRLPGRGAPKSFVRFSPDGAFLVAWASSLSTDDKDIGHEITLWNLRTPNRERAEFRKCIISISRKQRID
jgi:WD40 repeat protein